MVWIVLFAVLLPTQGGTPAERFKTAFNRGLDALTRKDLPAAETAFFEARKLNPKDPGVCTQLSQVYWLRGQKGHSITFLLEAISLDPAQPQAYLELARIYFELRRFNDVQQILSRLQAKKPGHPALALWRARVAQEQGEFEAAEQQFRSYLELEPQNAEAQSQLGSVYLALGKDEEAETWLKKAVEANPQLGTARLNLGLLYSQGGKNAAAREQLEAATRLLPENAEAFYYYGSMQVRLGDMEQGEIAFRRALELAPRHAQAQFALGSLLRRTGRAEEAAPWVAGYEQLKKAAEEDQDRIRLLAELHAQVKVLFDKDQLKGAEPKLAEILRLDPQNDLAFYRQSQIAFLRRQYQQALQLVRKAAALRSSEPSYPFLEGMCLERIGRDNEAMSAFERAVRLSDYVEAFGALARITARQQRFPDAIGWLQKAVLLDPGNPAWHMALAESLENAGRFNEGMEERKRANALQKKPD